MVEISLSKFVLHEHLQPLLLFNAIRSSIFFILCLCSVVVLEIFKKSTTSFWQHGQGSANRRKKQGEITQSLNQLDEGKDPEGMA